METRQRHVFSGSILMDGDRVIAMYHAATVGNMIALSGDPLLLKWGKVIGQAVIPIKSKTGFNKGREYNPGAKIPFVNYSLISLETSCSLVLPDVKIQGSRNRTGNDFSG